MKSNRRLMVIIGGLVLSGLMMSGTTLILHNARLKSDQSGQAKAQPVAPDSKQIVQPDNKPTPPKEDMIYVWSLPNSGHQSLIILNVIDGTTVDAAYLVPVRIKLKDVTAPALNEKGGKEARTVIDQLIGGQLVPAQLYGIGNGGVIADFWINYENKYDWLSNILTKEAKNDK